MNLSLDGGKRSHELKPHSDSADNAVLAFRASAGAHVYMVQFNKTLKVSFQVVLGALIYSAWSFLLTHNKKTETDKITSPFVNAFIPH